MKMNIMAIVLLLSSMSSYGKLKPNLANVAKRYGTAITSPLMRDVLKHNIKPPLNHTVGQVQTILLIMIITGIDLVKSR